MAGHWRKERRRGKEAAILLKVEQKFINAMMCGSIKDIDLIE